MFVTSAIGQHRPVTAPNCSRRSCRWPSCGKMYRLLEYFAACSVSITKLFVHSMKFLKILNRWLDSLFLRIYAMNMNRSYRSEPDNACTDAEIQMSTMLLMGIGILFLILGAVFFPIYLRFFFSNQDQIYISIILIGIAVVCGVHKRFGGYSTTPEAARPYVSKYNSRRSLTIYWLVMIASMVVIWAVLRHKQI